MGGILNVAGIGGFLGNPDEFYDQAASKGKRGANFSADGLNDDSIVNA